MNDSTEYMTKVQSLKGGARNGIKIGDRDV